MNKIAIFGANGRMGRVLIDAIAQSDNGKLTAAAVRAGSSLVGVDAGALAGIDHQDIPLVDKLDPYVNDINVLIDFSLPAALSANLNWCLHHHKPMVIGTTGLSAT
ncbi:MAG: 4-hydroxy-tetrahydrodipicolinate reductase, partial [Paraglaciecola sp.]